MTAEQKIPTEDDFKALFEKNREAFCLLMARNALRYLPMLASDKDVRQPFGYWNRARSDTKDEGHAIPGRSEDFRLRSLLAVWNGILMPWKYDSSLSEVVYRASLFRVSFISTSAPYVRAVSAVQAAISSAVAYDFVTYAYVSEAHTSDLFSAALVDDFNKVAGNKSDLSEVLRLRKSPLWPEIEPDEFQQLIDGRWSEWLKTLAKEVAEYDQRSAFLIERIETVYLDILNGVPNQIQHIPDDTVAVESVAEKDALNRSPLVTALANKLKDVGNTGHLTVGLLGNWGVGKSSVIKQLKIQLQPKVSGVQAVKNSLLSLSGVRYLLNKFSAGHGAPQFLYGEFNAWAYEHTNNIQAGIAQHALEALTTTQLQPKPDLEWPVKNKNAEAVSDENGKSLTEWFSFSVVWLRTAFYKVTDPLLLTIGRYVVWPLSRFWLTLVFSFRLHRQKMLALLVPLGIWYFDKHFGADYIGEYIPLLTDSLNKLMPFGEHGSDVVYTGGALGLLWLVFQQLKTIFAHPFAKELKTYLRLPDYGQHLGTIPVMREQITQLCNLRLHEGKRLMFVVDDLDRCSPEGIVKTFEAVRLVMDIPNVTVVIAVDHRIALAALSMNYQELSEHHQLGDAQAIARDYLGKMLHLSVRLREPEPQIVNSWLADIWDDKRWLKEHLSSLGVEHVDLADTVSSESQTNTTATNLSELVSSGDHNEGEAESLEQVVRMADQLTSQTEDYWRRAQPSKETILGLSLEQKHAMAFWLDAFDLNNPRQLKRLLNTYDVLRSIRINREESDDVILADYGQHGFPVMVTLCVAEFLCELDAARRLPIRQCIERGEAIETQLLPLLRQQKKQRGRNLNDIESEVKVVLPLVTIERWFEVEPYVLPAIDVEEITKDKKDA